MTPRISTVQDVISTFDQYGQRPAMLAMQADGVEEWTFGQLAWHSRRLATGLVHSGLQPGARVALLSPNRPEWLVACFALIQAGAVPVLIDAQIGQEALAHVLDDSGASWIVSVSDRLDSLPAQCEGQELHPLLLDANGNDPRSWRRFLSNEPRQPHDMAADDTAVLLYTSGTSGAAKGVPLSHRNLACNVQALIELDLLKTTDRFLLPLPLHHVYPFTVGMLVPLASGVPIILPWSLSGPQIVRAMSEAHVTFVLGVPRIYASLVSAIQDRVAHRGRLAALLFRTALVVSTILRKRTGLRLGRRLFSKLHHQLAPHLDTVVSGGAPIDPGLARTLEGLGWRFANGYGLTETSPVLSFNEPGKARIGTVGRPVPGVELRIAEPEGGRTHGEILARGPNVFSGYWNLPEKTQESFTPEGFFRTGDVGEFDDDGYLRVLGRASSLIILPGGENVRPEDVEESLTQSDVIREAGVLLRDNKLVAVVVPERDVFGQADEQEIDARVRQAVTERSRRLPSHHRLGEIVVSREPLARTRLGKIRRHLLERRYNELRRDRDITSEAPHGPIPLEEMAPEVQTLFEIPAARQTWEWLAQQYPHTRMTPETKLESELGIDSLDWLHFGLEIQQRTGRQLSEDAIRRVETVGDLLREIADAKQAEGGRGPDIVDRLQDPNQLLDDRQRRWLRTPGVMPRAIGWIGFAFGKRLLRCLFRLRVYGQENAVGADQVMFVPNHRSYLDAPSLVAALPNSQLRRIHWGGATSVMFRNPLMRLISRASRVIPVDPRRESTASLALAAAVLKQGGSLVWFPEGSVSRDGQLQPFRPGVALLLESHPVTVVPVWIEGTQKALPLGRWLPRPCQVSIFFGRPLPAEELLQTDVPDDHRSERIADVIHEHVAQLATFDPFPGNQHR